MRCERVLDDIHRYFEQLTYADFVGKLNARFLQDLQSSRYTHISIHRINLGKKRQDVAFQLNFEQYLHSFVICGCYKVSIYNSSTIDIILMQS